MNNVMIRRVAERAGLFIMLMFATLTLVACASAPVPPTESLNMAREAITNAEQAEARRYAGAELEEANRHLDAATKAAAAERMTEADRLAKQAVVAAELAMARTEAAKATEINREMGRGAEALDEEMRRQGDQQ
ncbi:DUF4398 domain-containing protein [Marinobacter halophilus]|uniref:DUF4398 domain-containing protein n=1 Tax=Marinobacter halophilus TaxID=1323740 RepID=A0A2T1K9M4_9GAMM|nr:DUF4398 domain-containing protein [Marinobacter halophilus]PSF06826.1 hypothetical protein C7H08_17275 [Marinobacter halophilus]GGC75859.1 hypothetical protein GCM10011362_25560 [Marinobacter halophilus]